MKYTGWYQNDFNVQGEARPAGARGQSAPPSHASHSVYRQAALRTCAPDSDPQALLS
jgi:hypothetical protein